MPHSSRVTAVTIIKCLYIFNFFIKDASVPRMPPPPDNNLASYSYTQLAGMMRYFKFCDHAIINCIHKKVDGTKLIDIFQHAASDEELCKELKLERLPEVFRLRQIVNLAEVGKKKIWCK